MLDFSPWNREHSRWRRPLTGLKGNKARLGATLAVPATVGGERWVTEATGSRPGRQTYCVEPRARKPAGAGVASPGSGKIGMRTTAVGDAHCRFIGGVWFMKMPARTSRDERSRTTRQNPNLPIRPYALPLALMISGALHAVVIALSPEAVPKLTSDPTLVYSTKLDAVLMDAVQDKGETLLPSEAAVESVASVDPVDPVDQLEREIQRLQDLTASQRSTLQKIHAKHTAEKVRHEKEILTLQESNKVIMDDRRQLQATVTQLEDARQALNAENASLRQTLANTVSDLRVGTQAQVALSVQVKTLVHDLDHQQKLNRRLYEKTQESEKARQSLQAEKKITDSANEQLAASLLGQELKLNTLRKENTELQQRLLSSTKLSLELERELDKSIAAARVEYQEMTEEQTALHQEMRMISSALKNQRAVSQQLRHDADQISQILDVLRAEQQETEAAYTETGARLLETTTVLRSISEENHQLRQELTRSAKTAANLRQQLNRTQASTASLETGNALRELRPVPTAGNPKPVYPRMAIRRGLEGEVGLSVSVSSSGQVSEVSVSKPSGYAILDQAAIDSVKKWEFTPATRDGIPTAMVIDIPVQFRLIDSRG